MAKKKSGQQKKGKGGGNGGGKATNGLSVSIPSTPTAESSTRSPAPPDKRSTSRDPQSDRGSQFQTPLTSPSSPTDDITSIDDLMGQGTAPAESTGGNDASEGTAEDIADDPSRKVGNEEQQKDPETDNSESTSTATDRTEDPSGAPGDPPVAPEAVNDPPAEETPVLPEETATTGAQIEDDALDLPIMETGTQPEATPTPVVPVDDASHSNESPTADPSTGVLTATENPGESEAMQHPDITDDDTVTNSPIVEKFTDDPSKQHQPTIAPVEPEVVHIDVPPTSSASTEPEHTEISFEEPPSTTDTLIHPTPTAWPEISADDIASKDIMAVAELFATMKKTLIYMTSAFERLGSQTEKMMSFSLDVHSAEQLKRLRRVLQAQIARQQAEVDVLKATLQTKIKSAVEEKIRTHVREVVQHSLKEVVAGKVQSQLEVQIPEDLRQKALLHQRQIFEVRTALHNSEARRYNALQTDRSARLRPLLRPLPTPEQSPVIAISRSSSQGNSSLPTPATAFPRVPAPTPIKRTFSNPFRTDIGPPTASTLFPQDLRALFSLGPEATRRLLREYGLVSAASTPAVETPPKHRGLPSVEEEAAIGSDSDHGSGGENDQEAHAADMNKFMAHIGVPFLMIPPPKEKENMGVPMSSKTRRKMLTPLIIK
ncbi:hypothetical protein NLJ89_g2168 [Agrocybe chaxingu]|uniref:Uncharacterized protein n=1 Tax=Agrocybe chaxingu TaxID=84603 RepID=A0A9W8MWQ9_9AGAR|nr:hypothetical protein NLJ89_g2168 [Agrocybe chaxingu]